MNRYEVTLTYKGEPQITRTIVAANETAAIVMAKERARQDGWKSQAKSFRVEVIEPIKGGV